MNPTARVAAVGSFLFSTCALAQGRPLVVELFAGVEGFSGPLAPQVNRGATYGLTVAVERWRFLGVELGYSGTQAPLKSSPSRNVDVVRDGAYLGMTPGWTFDLGQEHAMSLKPYVLAGIGIDDFTVHDAAPAAGYSQQTDAFGLAGVGLELRASTLVVSARFNCAYEWGAPFNPFDKDPLRYQAMLSFGRAF